MKAAEMSGTAIGLRGKDGCVLAVEKVITSKLHEPDSGRRIYTIENSIGMVRIGYVEVTLKIMTIQKLYRQLMFVQNMLYIFIGSLWLNY